MLFLFNDILSFLLPDHCRACIRPLLPSEKYFCLTCDFVFSLFYKNHSLTALFCPSIPITYAGALIQYEKSGFSQHIIHQIKYEDQTEMALHLGERLGKHHRQSIASTAALILSVPLHPKKQKQRGYNQSDHIAMGLAKALHIPFEKDILRRKIHTKSQTKKSKTARKENVKNAFELVSAESLSGKHIILVDDVITTGATLESCCKAIMKAPGVQISILCLAVA